MKNEKIIAIITGSIPNKIELGYVDYRDNIENSIPSLMEQIRDPENCKFYEEIDEAFEDQKGELEQYQIKELQSELKNHFNRTFGDYAEEIAEEITEKFEDEIREILWARDEFNPYPQLFSNTGPIVAFYDLETEIEGYGCDLAQELETVKSALKIESTEFDQDLKQMILQSSYGGELVVYFHLDAEELLKPGEHGKIAFKNPSIAIIDTRNGSGDHCHLQGHSFEVDFSRGNIFADKEIKYNYTYAVCGLYSDWCQDTEYILKPGEPKESQSAKVAELEREKKLDETFKNGGCTSGDMDFKRHRSITYINNFPCGHKCGNCGTFWID